MLLPSETTEILWACQRGAEGLGKHITYEEQPFGEYAISWRQIGREVLQLRRHCVCVLLSIKGAQVPQERDSLVPSQSLLKSTR